MTRNQSGLRATEREQHEAYLLAQIARVPRSESSFDGVFRAVMSQVEDAFDFAIGVLAFIDEDDGVELATLITRPMAPQVIEEIQFLALEALLAERRQVPFAHVFRRLLEPVDDFVPNVGPRLASVSTTPIMTAGRLTGLMVLAGDRIRPASQPFLEQLANQAMLVCEHSRLLERVRTLSVRDDLTGAFSRRHTVERLAMEFERSRRHQTPLSVIMLDVDHLARINSEHGMPGGGAVLRETARRISQSLRGSDCIGRYEGGRLLIILPHTPLDGALVVAERARKLIASEPFTLSGHVPTPCTVTAGVASMACPGVIGAAGMVNEAEKAMMFAKHLRNCVGSAEG